MAAGKGKGWFGDSEGHSKAGRKGGLARSRKIRAKQQYSPGDYLKMN